jgi:hypothetical protein
MKFCVIFLGLSLALAACSSKDTPPDPYATATQFCQAWGQAACTSQAVLACSGEDTLTDALSKACVDSQEIFCEGLLPATGYSSAQASSCLSAVQQAYGDGKLTALEIATVRHRGSPCNHLIKGAQPAGGTCLRDDDCDTLQDYLCVTKDGEGSCQIPTLADNGTSCDAPGATCNPGFYCDGNCVQSKAVGGKCATDVECDTGLICDPAALKCIAPGKPGSCTKDEDCTTGNVCDIPVGAMSGMCVKSIPLGPSESVCEDLR